MGFNKGNSLAERMAKKQAQRTAEVSVVEKTEPTEVAAVVTEKNAGVGRPASSADVLQEQSQAARVDQSVQYINLELIDVEAQVREEFDQDYIEDLATDFAISPTKQPDQPVTVWARNNGRFLLADGENRFRAMMFAAENREALGVKDLSAFTAIRATIKEGEPNKLERIQAQAKANLLRDNLTDVEIGKAAALYLEMNKDASRGDVADWIGFRNRSSGRVRVTNALKLVNTCSADLIEQVAKGTLGTANAFKIQAERDKEERGNNNDLSSDGAPTAAKKSSEMLSKATSGKNALTVSLPLESLKIAAEIIGLVAASNNVDVDLGDPDDFTRKSAAQVFKAEVLQKILNSMEK